MSAAFIPVIPSRVGCLPLVQEHELIRVDVLAWFAVSPPVFRARVLVRITGHASSPTGSYMVQKMYGSSR